MTKYLSKLVAIVIVLLWVIGINSAYAVTTVISPISIQPTKPITITINPIATPKIITQPISQATVTSSTVSFSIVATGTPAPSYQWRQSINGGAFTNIPGANGPVYTLIASIADNGMQYQCVVTNSVGSIISASAILKVTPAVPPKITIQPLNQTVAKGGTISLSITAIGTPAPSYQWRQSINGGAYTNITGATGTSYTAVASTSTNGTQYQCMVSNVAGSVLSNAVSVKVTIITIAPADPNIITQPYSETVTEPSPATFTVVASGNSTLNYQWMQSVNGGAFANIVGATGASYTTTPTSPTNNGTQYKCVITDAAGSATSMAATLTVTLVLFPVITAEPANASVIVSSPATFTVLASGIPAPTYQWMQELPNTSTFTTILGATGTSYTISKTTLAQSGTLYECVATNTWGTATSNLATLTVGSQPIVSIISPNNQSTLTTGSLSVTAAASDNTGGSVSKVTFYDGAALLGTVNGTSQAFTYLWNNIPPGTHYLTAVATDSTGPITTSAPVTITINAGASGGIDDNLASRSDPLGHTTSYQYDNLNRLTKTTFADSSTVSYAYDPFGNQTSVTDQRGNVSTKTYDAYERLSQTKDPNGGITQYSYDTQGRLLTLTDANSHATIYTYDPNDKMLTQTNALNLTTTFTYDPNGNIATRHDANSKTTTYTYDALNRLTNTAYPDGTSIANAYDAIGRKTSMTDATGKTSYGYDNLNRLTGKTFPGTSNKITYTYDTEGNRLTSIDQNNRTITNSYDVLNRLSTVKDANGTSTYNDDADSNLTSMVKPNGVTESYTYDALNRVLTAVNAHVSTVVSSFSNVYDIAGMITKKTLADGSWTAYSYDSLNRLLEETKQTGSSIIYDYVYTYDLVGNHLSSMKNTTLGGFWSTDSANMPSQVLTNMTNAGYGNTANPAQAVSLARNYVYDAGNQLNNWNYNVNIYSATFPVQTDTYGYDNNGNRTSKQAVLTGQESTPQQTTYGYDFENRLNQLQYTNIPKITGTQTDNLFYNGEGLRVQASLNSAATNYLYDGSNVLIERNASGSTTKFYTRGLDLGGGIGSIINQNYTANNTSVVQYYDYNDLGSTADLTASSGTVADSYNYDAFGNLLTTPAAGDTNRYFFSTKELDSRSGLYYFGGRYYDPEIGRWLTQDPTGFSDGVNLYLYAHDNPINLVDPNGSVSQPLIVAAGAVIGGAVEAAKYYQAYASGRISGQQYAELIGVGGATGAVSTLSNGVVGGALLGGAGSAVNNAAEQQIVNGNINYNDVGTAFGTGAAVGLLGGAGTNLGGNIIKYPNLNEIYIGGSPVIDYGAAGGLIGSTVGTILTTPSGQNMAPNWAGKEGIKG